MGQGKKPVLGSRGEEVKPAVSGTALMVREKSAWMKIWGGDPDGEPVKKRGFQVTGVTVGQ